MTFDMRRQDGTCPLGGTWYKCAVDLGGFSGCCTMDPCLPGGGCPEEKDLTPGRSRFTLSPDMAQLELTQSIDAPTSTKGSTTPTASSFQTSDVSFVKLPIPTTSSSQVPSSTIVSTTASVAVNDQPSDTPNRSSSPVNGRPLPLAAIIGAAVGAIVLLGLVLFLLVCLRRRKHRGVYQAPIYVSPYNTGCDMSQKSASSWEPKARKSSLGIQQLDSRGIGGPRYMADDALRCFAELPGEPVAVVR
jgi:hypothetical protein